MIEEQLKEIRALYRTRAIFYTAQKTELTEQEFTNIVDFLKVENKDGQHKISGELVLTLRNGRAFITTNIAIYGTQEDE
jgi:hypothetical protein